MCCVKVGKVAQEEVGVGRETLHCGWQCFSYHFRTSGSGCFPCWTGPESHQVEDKLSANNPTLTSVHSLSQPLDIEAGDPGHVTESSAMSKHPRVLLSEMLEKEAIATVY